MQGSGSGEAPCVEPGKGGTALKATGMPVGAGPGNGDLVGVPVFGVAVVWDLAAEGLSMNAPMLILGGGGCSSFIPVPRRSTGTAAEGCIKCCVGSGGIAGLGCMLGCFGLAVHPRCAPCFTRGGEASLVGACAAM